MKYKPKDLSKADLAKARIEHLSKEIETVTRNLMIFRTRIGFTFLVGPFFVMGSVLIATKGVFEVPDWDRELVTLAIVAAVAYLASGAWGAVYDRGCQVQCNTWRAAIVALHNKPSASPKIIPQVHARWAYGSGFFLVLILFVALVRCLRFVLPSEGDWWEETRKTFEQFKSSIPDVSVGAGPSGNAMASSDLLSLIAIGISMLALVWTVFSWKRVKHHP